MGRGGRLARLGGKDRTSFLGRGAWEPRGGGTPSIGPQTSHVQRNRDMSIKSQVSYSTLES